MGARGKCFKATTLTSVGEKVAAARTQPFPRVTCSSTCRTAKAPRSAEIPRDLTPPARHVRRGGSPCWRGGPSTGVGACPSAAHSLPRHQVTLLTGELTWQVPECAALLRSSCLLLPTVDLSPPRVWMSQSLGREVITAQIQGSRAATSWVLAYPVRPPCHILSKQLLSHQLYA